MGGNEGKTNVSTSKLHEEEKCRLNNLGPLLEKMYDENNNYANQIYYLYITIRRRMSRSVKTTKLKWKNLAPLRGNWIFLLGSLSLDLM